jgi:MFS family permease
MIIPALPLYAHGFNATDWQIGFLLASFSFMQFLASPVLGWISDHYGRIARQEGRFNLRQASKKPAVGVSESSR